jgi:uncharacterized protein with HEPN domain
VVSGRGRRRGFENSFAREWRLRVEDILEAVAKIERYVTGLSFEQFQADQKTVDAVVRNLEVIGEAVRHLSTDQESLPAGVPWTDIAGMRNVLIHEYFGVDLSIIWQTVTHDLPALRDQLQRFFK